MFCLNLMRIALELAKENRAYEALATKFFQHYAYVAAAMKHMGEPRLPALGRGGRLLLRRAALSRRPLPQVPRPLAGRPDPAVRRRAAGGEVDRAVQGVHGELRLVPEEPPRAWSRASSTRSSTTARSTHVLTILNQDQLRRLTERIWRPGRVPLRLRHPQPLEGPRGAPVRVRRQRRRLRAGRGGRRRSRGATRTGAGRSGSRPASC